MELNKISDRLLLEQIYILLINMYLKVNEIDDDAKTLFMNTVANLIADKIAFNNKI